MHKYIVAVSGGVDSVVLLDMLSKLQNLDLIVAHFDHGIRADSHLDAMFVESLAKRYDLPFEMIREELGSNASEEKARNRRYHFLRSVAKRYDGKIVTAHHSDDAIETIAINLLRGTGWRGLAVLDSGLLRPLTHMSKSEIINYANKNNLDWREDSTNSSDVYLRNRLRHETSKIEDDLKMQLLSLWSEQKLLKSKIDIEIKNILKNDSTYSRYFFTNIEPKVALEILKVIVKSRLTRPQLIKALHSIKTFMPSKTYQAGDGVKFNFTSRNFTVELIK